MFLSFEGRRAIVCGSTQGIGLAIAKMLAASGASITAFARNPAALQDTISLLHSSNTQQHNWIAADFSDPDAVYTALINSGIHSADIIINNSGGPPPGPAHKASIPQFYEAFNRLLMSSHIIVQHFIPAMKQAEYGRIINIISTSVKQPLDNLGVSNTVRGATASWAKTLANELAPFGITVNNILPGATLTGRLDALIERKSAELNISREQAAQAMADEIPMRRLGQPDDIAAAAVFLASEMAGYITGINLPVDGGRTKSL
jgi:3-oxoacyl-[acyl-carrier protein] reductase